MNGFSLSRRSARLLRWLIVIAFLSLAVAPILPPARPAAADPPPTSFADEFDATTLDPAWQVVEFTGTRVNGGQGTPANHISLTSNPGHLRYYVDPMTYAWGFWNNYQTLISYYPYDPGLELHRLFNGEHWVFETKADYYLPYTNGRGQNVYIYFGDSGANSFAAIFQRYRDVYGSCNCMSLGLYEGPTYDTMTMLENSSYYEDIYGGNNSTYFLRIERDGGILTASWSLDGVTWTQVWSRDMGTQLDGLQQRVVITGLSWFNAAGSYADYDYVRLTETALPDTAAPTANASQNPAANGAGWNNTDVTVTWNWSDEEGGSGIDIDNCTASSTSTGEGTIELTATCSDLAGNSGSATYSVQVDQTPPTVEVTGVSNGASYVLGNVPTAGCSTTDDRSGVAVEAVLSVSGGTANGVGSFTATCSGAMDNAGNSSSASVTFQVIYNWTGFFSPVDNLPTLNTVNAGSAIPAKFSLGGNQGLNIFAPSYPRVIQIACPASVPVDPIEQTANAANSSLNYDPASDQYNFVWKTDRAWSGTCRQLVVQLVDGTDHLANFKFR